MSKITAAIIIIGNEILSGRTKDSNVNFIASLLPEAGITLEEVAIIPDIEDRIMQKAKEFSAKYDYVFTTGGIGPTHDDITAESIAKAFGTEIEFNQEALEILEDGYRKMNRKINPASRKMAMMPKGAELIDNLVSSAPGFALGNVYVMAGIPEIMQSMFKSILPKLRKGSPVQSRQVSILAGESLVAEALSSLQRKYKHIEMGSYPFKHNNIHATSLVLRGDDENSLDNAFNELKKLIEEHEIIT